MKWISVEERLPSKGRVVAFTPDCPVQHPLRFRVMDSQFVRISGDVTHWMEITEPEVSTDPRIESKREGQEL